MLGKLTGKTATELNPKLYLYSIGTTASTFGDKLLVRWGNVYSIKATHLWTRPRLRGNQTGTMGTGNKTVPLQARGFMFTAVMRSVITIRSELHTCYNSDKELYTADKYQKTSRQNVQLCCELKHHHHAVLHSYCRSGVLTGSHCSSAMTRSALFVVTQPTLLRSPNTKILSK